MSELVNAKTGKAPHLSAGKLKAAMDRSGLSQRQLALRCGVSQQAVNRIVTGKRPDPSISTVARIADALGVGIESLLEHRRRS